MPELAKNKGNLPEPSPEALGHSRQVAQHIADEIEAAGGWISFARYMELALYAPGLGYYAAGAAKLGRDGDFVTAPEITPLFGRALARQVMQILESAGGDVLELGAGSGRLAAHLLLALERAGGLPEHYRILEVSSELRVRQRETIALLAPSTMDRLQWVSSLPAKIRGVVVGNEVLDSLPVHVAAWRESGLFERGVTNARNRFEWSERPASEALLAAANSIAVPRPYVSELNLAARALTATLAERIERGVMLFIDYGFGRSEYFHPQRNMGTLMCHYRHRAHDDPFFRPGLQDITSHVDFSAIAEAGAQAGSELLGYATQAQFLLNCGITEMLGETPADDAASYLPQAAAVHKLLSPAEMGELFKAIALGRGVNAPVTGFNEGNKAHLL